MYNIKEIAKAIQKIEGVGDNTLFKDIKKFNSTLADFAPRLQNERKIFSRALDDVMLNKIWQICNSRSNEQQIEFITFEQQLRDNYGLSKEWSYVIVSSFIEAYECKNPLKYEEENQQENPTIIRSSDSQKTSVIHHTTSEVKKGIIPTELRAYAGSGYWDERKIFGGYYLKSETMYIWVQMLFKNEGHLPTTTLHWEIYRADGSSYSGPQQTTVELGPNHESVTHAWGWNEKGNWDVGRYYIIARLDDSESLRADFEIAYGNYSDTKIKVNNLKLFNAGDSVETSDTYEDTRLFYNDTLRRVYFNFHFKPLRDSAYVTMNYKIVDPNGNIFANMGCPINIPTDWDQCWTGNGWSNTGMWKRGKYLYEASLGNSKVFSGEFIVK